MIGQKIGEGDGCSIRERNGEIRALLSNDCVHTLRCFFRVFLVGFAKADIENAGADRK